MSRLTISLDGAEKLTCGSSFPWTALSGPKMRLPYGLVLRVFAQFLFIAQGPPPWQCWEWCCITFTVQCWIICVENFQHFSPPERKRI